MAFLDSICHIVVDDDIRSRSDLLRGSRDRKATNRLFFSADATVEPERQVT